MPQTTPTAAPTTPPAPTNTTLMRRRVALLAGGAFNPPTRMHFEMFALAKAHLEAIITPTADEDDAAVVSNAECGCAAKLPDADAVVIAANAANSKANKVNELTNHRGNNESMMKTPTRDKKLIVYHVVEGILSPVADAFGKAALIPAAHRLHMCELGAARFDWLRADGTECARDYWTKTLAMLKHHQAELTARAETTAAAVGEEQECTAPSPPPRLMMLCGADVIASFTKLLVDETEIKRFGRLTLWDPFEVSEIAERFGIVVIERGEAASVRDSLAQMHLSAAALRNIHIVEVGGGDDAESSHFISSTRVRELMQSGGDYAALNELVYPEVAAYIEANRLYR